MILLIDNYDSFSYNLYQLVGSINPDIRVVRNDALSVAEVDRVVFGGHAPELREGSWNPLPSRREAVSFMLDRIEGGYGSTRAYLCACGVDDACLDALRGMLVGSD